jgi:hypothetical protein
MVSRLRLYYTLEPSGVRNRCPTWILTAAASKAFAGSGEVEDGTIGLEDVICVAASLIDQVSHLWSGGAWLMTPRASYWDFCRTPSKR